MIRNKLQTDLITALKSKDEFKTSCLRLILSQIKNKEIDKKAELDDPETIAVLKKIAKENRESILAFEKGGRQDLLDKTKQELAIIQSYLPPELSDEDLKKEIETIIKNNQEMVVKNPKIIIGLCIKELRAKADGARIIKILSSLISL